MNNLSFRITEQNGCIVNISLMKHSKNYETRNETSLEQRCRKEIEEYLDGRRKIFSIPIHFSGTVFQEKVWKEMMKIPYGKTISYKELSKRIGNDKACRAVANACGKNNLPIIIPCHRVIASNGIGGYSSGVEIKKYLLAIEQSN